MTSLDSNLEKMKEEALEMGKYYFKGFGNILSGILSNADTYLMEGYGGTENFNNAYNLIEKIEMHYEQIPFCELHGKNNFYPLFVTKRLLPKFRYTMDKVFKEKRQDALINLDIDIKSIVTVGRLYDDSFQNILKEIRTYPESSDFKVRIIDHKNKIWYL